jgi:hypothetical protein
MVAHFGLDVVRAYMGHVQDNAEEAVRRVITALKDGAVHAMNSTTARASRWRSGRPRRAQRRDRLHRHLGQLPNNFNAPSSVCMAAVLYVFRTLVDDEIPLNAGCLKPLKVIIPPGSMLNPHYPASVVSGNVETSTCITNALYGALGVMAAAQGTMNNFTFGNARYQYYETISGGSRRGRGLRRHRRGADQHDQLAPDRSGDPRVPLPGAAGELCDPAGLRRGGALAWREWRRAQGALPGADDGGDPVEQPDPCAVRDGRRRAGARGVNTVCARMGGSRSSGISARSIWRPGTCS